MKYNAFKRFSKNRLNEKNLLDFDDIDDILDDDTSVADPAEISSIDDVEEIGDSDFDVPDDFDSDNDILDTISDDDDLEKLQNKIKYNEYTDLDVQLQKAEKAILDHVKTLLRPGSISSSARVELLLDMQHAVVEQNSYSRDLKYVPVKVVYHGITVAGSTNFVIITEEIVKILQNLCCDYHYYSKLDREIPSLYGVFNPDIKQDTIILIDSFYDKDFDAMFKNVKNGVRNGIIQETSLLQSNVKIMLNERHPIDDIDYKQIIENICAALMYLSSNKSNASYYRDALPNINDIIKSYPALQSLEIHYGTPGNDFVSHKTYENLFKLLSGLAKKFNHDFNAADGKLPNSKKFLAPWAAFEYTGDKANKFVKIDIR